MSGIEPRGFSFESIRTSAILVVADDGAALDQLRTALSDAGYSDVRAVSNPGIVERLCRQVDFDLLVIDAGSARIGVDLVAAVMRIYGSEVVPVIALVDKGNTDSHRQTLEAGASEVLSNPCPDWELLHSVRNALRTRALFRRSEEHNRELEHRVSERTRALEEALAMAQRAERAKFDFLSVMSHELRTPLNSIIGFSEMLASQSEGPLGHPNYVEYVHLLEMSGRVLLSMVNNILDFARGATGAIELNESEIDLNELLGACVTQMWLKAQGKRVRMRFDPGEPVRLRGDSRRIGECVTALLDNAIKFQSRDGNVVLRTVFGPDAMKIEVSDDGPGMSKETLSRIFEPFVQGERGLGRHYAGIGLGLPMVRRLVELHDGRVAIESDEGSGTTVAIYLPMGRITLSDSEPALVNAAG